MSGKNDYADHALGDCSYDHRGEEVKLSVLGLAVALTLGFSAVELFFGWVSNSLALIGDAGHMATDSASLFLRWLPTLFPVRALMPTIVSDTAASRFWRRF